MYITLACRTTPCPPSMSSTDATASAASAACAASAIADASAASAIADASAGGTVIEDYWADSDEQYAFYAEHYPQYALEDEAIAEAFRRVAEKRASAVRASGDED